MSVFHDGDFSSEVVYLACDVICRVRCADRHFGPHSGPYGVQFRNCKHSRLNGKGLTATLSLSVATITYPSSYFGCVELIARTFFPSISRGRSQLLVKSTQLAVRCEIYMQAKAWAAGIASMSRGEWGGSPVGSNNARVAFAVVQLRGFAAIQGTYRWEFGTG